MTNSKPVSDIWKEYADQWVDADAAARILDETKSAVFAEMCSQYSDLAVNKAELKVRSSPQWRDFLDKMVAAKTRANRAKIQMDYWTMKSWEQRSKEATERTEARL